MNLGIIVKINGVDKSAILNNSFISVVVEDSCGISVDNITLHLQNIDNVISLGELGATLELIVSINENKYSAGSYRIDEALIGDQELIIYAQSKTFKNQEVKNRTHNTLKESLNLIAKEEGLTLVVDKEIDKFSKPIYQFNQSNMQFLSYIVENLGLLVKIVEEKLVVVGLYNDKSSSGDSLEVYDITTLATSYQIKKEYFKYNGLIKRYYDALEGSYIEYKVGSEPYKQEQSIMNEISEAETKQKYLSRNIAYFELPLSPQMKAGDILKFNNQEYFVEKLIHTIDNNNNLTEIYCYFK